jgi:hypothetical protein
MNDIANFLPKAAISLLKQLPNTNNARKVRSGQTASGELKTRFSHLQQKHVKRVYFH